MDSKTYAEARRLMGLASRWNMLTRVMTAVGLLGVLWSDWWQARARRCAERANAHLCASSELLDVAAPPLPDWLHKP